MLFNNPFVGVAKVSANGPKVGTFLKVNKAFAGFIGYLPHELEGKTFQEITTPDTLNKDLNELEKIIKGEIDYYTIEKSYYHKNGSIVRIFLNASVIRKENKEIDYFLAQIINMTDYYNLTSEMMRTKERVEKMNLELINLIHIISHDLHEPLRAISGYLSILERSIDDCSPQCLDHKRYVNKAIQGSVKLSGMIDSLLEYSRLNKDQDRNVADLNSLISEACLNLSESIKKNKAKIVVKSNVEMHVNSPQFVSLFQNLISNSIKFRREEIPLIKISIGTEPSHFVIKVSDNGIGIEDHFKKEIFKIFKKLHLKKEYPGKGLGLSIVKRIVDLHNGSIEVDTKVGLGTTFKIVLPIELLVKDE